MDKKNLQQDLIEFFLRNKGKIIGAVIGFIFGILFLVLGFFKTLIIIACTIAGYFIGSQRDIEGDFRKLLDKILPRQSR